MFELVENFSALIVIEILEKWNNVYDFTKGLQRFS